MLGKHKGKKAACWKCFGLDKDIPYCIAVTNVDGSGTCGVEPAVSGGASNAWDHLFRFHRPLWLELMEEDGKLAASGQEALVGIQTALNARHERLKTSMTNVKLDPEAKASLDALAAKMVVMDDRDYSDCETKGFIE